MALKLASFDLDGTLIHPAIFNAVADEMGFGHLLEETTRAYFDGRMSADETFHADYKHFVGRDVAEMRAVLRRSARWTPRIREAVAMLHDAGLKVAVTTDQPDFLVEATRELFGVDELVCSRGVVRDGRVTGEYELAHDKWANLSARLRDLRIAPREVTHAGNGSNDVPVMRQVGLGIAAFPMNDGVRCAAAVVLEKPDAVDIARAILDAA